ISDASAPGCTYRHIACSISFAPSWQLRRELVECGARRTDFLCDLVERSHELGLAFSLGPTGPKRVIQSFENLTVVRLGMGSLVVSQVDDVRRILQTHPRLFKECL